MHASSWATAVSLSLGIVELTGCGKTPSVPTSVAVPRAATAPAAGAAANTGMAYTGGLAAQVASADAATPAAAATASPLTATTPVATNPVSISTAVPVQSTVVITPPTVIAPAVGGLTGSIGSGLNASLGAFTFGAGDLVAFQSNRDTGGGACSDIFIYDANVQTVLALPAVNTAANETNPRLSSNGLYLVYQTDEAGSQDVRVFGLQNQLIDTLRTLNTPNFDEMQPDISDDGSLIVYVSNEPDGGALPGTNTLRIYNTLNGADYIAPVANRGLGDISWPTLSGNGSAIAYGATAGPGTCQQIFVYSLLAAAQLTPPFLNDGNADQYNPDLDETGTHIVYVSNRRGSEDIYMTDMTSGFTDNMVLANSSAAEQEPRFLGLGSERVVFQSNRTGTFRLYAYDMATALLDTLPIANEVGSDSQLRSAQPSISSLSP